MSVSELNSQIRGTLERGFASVWIEGEISNFVAASSGHWYFSLRDGDSQIRCACFKTQNWKVRFKPENGLQVTVRGRVTVYERKGEYQILVDSLEPVGEGALLIAFEQIKERLNREGLFAEELKRPLPFLPRRVGVVTSPDGAAFHDILNVLSRRTRSVNITLIPTRVQGEGAGEEIRAAVEMANEFNLSAGPDEKIDVLIVGRGGGSTEDLWAFNEERLARAIRASEIPVISAVGHEIDWTIADFVSDRRAPTPSAAAEIVAESEDSIAQFVDDSSRRLRQIIDQKMFHSSSRLRDLAFAPAMTAFPASVRRRREEVFRLNVRLAEILTNRVRRVRSAFEDSRRRLSPVGLAARFGNLRTRLAVLNERQESAARNLLARRDESLKVATAALDALSPLKVLGRGYSITLSEDGRVLTSVENVRQKERVRIRLSDGRIDAEVAGTEKD